MTTVLFLTAETILNIFRLQGREPLFMLIKDLGNCLPQCQVKFGIKAADGKCTARA